MRVSLGARMSCFLAVILLLACSRDAGGPSAVDPYLIGLFTDSITPGSSLYRSPIWAISTVFRGADSMHSGVGTPRGVGRDEGPFCLGPSGQLIGERSMEFVALGDTIYTEADPDGPGGNMPNDTAFSHLLGRFDSFAILDSVLRGQLDSSVPGLVVFTTGAFDPTSSQYGRGATPDSAILMHWTLADRGPSFVEDTARAALALCNLR